MRGFKGRVLAGLSIFVLGFTAFASAQATATVAGSVKTRKAP